MEQERMQREPSATLNVGDAAGRADRATKSAGEAVEAAAVRVREHLPQEGRLGAVAGKFADTLEQSGAYLRQEGLTGVLDDLETLIRRYPVQALLLGVGIGYVLSRVRMR